ncbi:MAG TPA: DUF3617 family protein [Burkholderiales bacterium]
MNRFLLLLVLSLGAASALAQDAPRRKSGLWEISMSMAQMPAPMVSRQCVDEKTDDFGSRPPRGGAQKCSRQSVRREGGSVIVESVCQIEGSTATSRGVFTGDFGTAYKGEMTTKFSPPMHGMAESKMSFQAHLTGPCAPGQKPGDIAVQGMPGGAGGKMSADDARRMAEELRKQYQK